MKKNGALFTTAIYTNLYEPQSADVSTTESRTTKLLCFSSVFKGILWSIIACGAILVYMSHFITRLNQIFEVW
jgi:hypothetical protein